MRDRGGSGPAPPHQPGPAAQAGLRHRHGALPDPRRRRTRDRRGDPGAAGHREDLDPPGAGPTATAQGPRAYGGARLKPPEPRLRSQTPRPRLRCLQLPGRRCAPCQHEPADMRVNPVALAMGTVRARLVRPQQLTRHGTSAVQAPSSRHFTARSTDAGLLQAPVSRRLEGGSSSCRLQCKGLVLSREFNSSNYYQMLDKLWSSPKSRGPLPDLAFIVGRSHRQPADGPGAAGARATDGCGR